MDTYSMEFIRKEQPSSCFLCWKNGIQLRCTDCNVLICNGCKKTHLKVKSSREHHITRIIIGWERKGQENVK